MDALSGKNILVTGGCGSIGTPLVERILECNPGVVRIFDNDEEGLFKLQQRLGGEAPVRYLLGNVRNAERLKLAIEDIDVIFHTAALKHVELNEYNPFETVQTNVQGTQNLIQAALEEEVESVVGVSTDKASNPSSVMGATKLLAERLIIAANTYKGSRETRFGCVRFGNVLGSSGSVVPIFMNQVEQGGPVTVTNPEMTRFIMPIDEAAGLVLKAYTRMTSGEVFVLKMPAFRVGTLAEAMIEEYAPHFGYNSEDINVKVIGAKPGERVHEKLISADEQNHAYERDDMYIIFPQINLDTYEDMEYPQGEPVTSSYTSADGSLLSKGRIIEMIEKHTHL